MSRVVALLGAMALTGCVSVIGEKMQPLALQTVLDGKEIAGLGSTLSNDAGTPRQVDTAGVPSTAALAPVDVPLKPMSPSQAAARVY